MVSKHVDYLMKSSSWIRRMFEEGIELKARIGAENVCDFTLGNPEQQPPVNFYHRLRSVVEQPKPGLHRYMPNPGFPSTREAIAKHYSQEFNHQLSGHDVIMTVGSAGGLNVVLKSILNSGEEVIVFTPAFSEYQFYIDTHGGVMVQVATDQQFLPDLDKLEAAITSKTKAIIINSPNNPTGVVYPQSIYKGIAAIVNRKNSETESPIYLISDEPYRRIIYDDVKMPVLFDYYPYSVVAISHSKDLALAGERIGYLIMHPELPEKEELMNAMAFCNRILGFINAPATMQYLIEGLLSDSVDIDGYRQKRDLLYEVFREGGLEFEKPSGTFYLFPPHPMKSDLDFINHLKKYNILAVPGMGFGTSGHFRISYAVDLDTVERSLPLFRKALADLK